MEKMSEKEAKQILDALSKKANITHRSCPACNALEFTCLDGYFNHSVQPTLTTNLLSHAVGDIPYFLSIVIICQKCGYVTQYAADVLIEQPIKLLRKNE